MTSLIKKIQISVLLTVFVLVSVLGSLTWTVPAHAQMVTSDVNSGTQLGLEQADKIKLTIKEKAVMLMMQAVMSGLNYFMNKIAYDSAVYLASGGHGQKPFAHKDGAAGYFKNVAGDALGEALGQISEGTGYNLCELPDPRLDLALKLSLNYQYTEPKPKCSWQQLKAAYNTDNIKSKYFSKEGALSRIAVSMDVSGSDFGVWMDAKAKIDQHAQEAEKGAEVDRQEGNGFKAMTDIITGEVKTPASVIEQEFKSGAPSQQKDSQSSTMGPLMGAAMQKGAISVVYQTVGTFVNTLLGTMVKNFTTQGMLPTGKKLCNPGLSITGISLEPCADNESSSLATSYYSGGSVTSNRRAAQEMFNELLVPKIKTVENFEILNNLASCSEDDKNPYSCLVDQVFLQILQAAEAEKPMTIREAIEKDWLHGSWKIISDSDSMNAKWNCVEDQVYCYRNSQTLRKLRILPLGFEVAAVEMPNPEQPPSLKEVVDAFIDVASPYYHLINPNWIVKLPKMRCNAQAPGQIPQNGARLEECVDLQHCVGYTKDGSCSTYGYCLKENQTWTFGSDYCDWQNDTCTLYTDDKNGETVSYLSRTTDNRFCDENNIGCRSYSTVKFLQNNNNETTLNWSGQNNFNTFESHFEDMVNDGDDPTWVNAGVNLNAKMGTCDPANSGCSAFKIASDVNKTVFLKKAPDYLGCYDSETLVGNNQYTISRQIDKMLNGVQWPQTLSDLGRIQPKDTAACENDYAHVCLPEEDGCNYYMSANTGEKIPGKFQPAELVTNQGTGEQEIEWNNQCDQKCLGYDAFLQLPSEYDPGKNIEYIIPSSGKTCDASEAGCTSFTNLSETAGDFEKVEYFSYLRPCILPDQNKQKTFYSYESTENGDLRLTTFVLEANANGSPKVIYRNKADYTANLNSCNKTKYEAGTSDANCRRLDESANSGVGNSYFVNITKTILVSDQCTPYRLDETAKYSDDSALDPYCPYEYAGPGALTDSQAVERRSGTCYYYGLKSGSTAGAGETSTCTKEVDSCRGYKGNTGNNYRVAIDDNFETYNSTAEMEDVWKNLNANVEWSTESTNASGHSMRIDPENTGVDARIFQNIGLTSGKSYNISFWARGGGVITSIILKASMAASGADAVTGDLNVTDVWHYYTFGPVEYNGIDDAEGEIFIHMLGGDGSRDIVYLDNIRVTENTDYMYLVRDSLSVDPICDSNTNDNLPGEALGCRAYKDSSKTDFYLTGFSYLCREGAIGCTGLIDTFNTLDEERSKYYNIWVSALSDDDYGDVDVTVGGSTYTCFIERGEKGCYINTVGNTAAEIYANSRLSFTSSTQYFPADTSTSSPVYLVINEKSVCRSENLGCQITGRSSVSYEGETFEDVAVKNDPALYGNILCSDQAIGCGSYSANGGKYYFKDPNITGGRICEWKDETSKHGWFIKGTNNPCYDNYTVTTNLFNDNDFNGLRSNGHSSYNGSVGICPEDQNGCSEFAEPEAGVGYVEYKKCRKTNVRCYNDSDCEEEEDVCESNSAHSYFLLDNQKLRENSKDCNGMVSIHEGCVLFDKSSVPDKYWDTAVSYSGSGALREPVSTATNDANVILKVNRDRICTDWAYCSDYQQVDEETRKCHRLNMCREAGLSSGASVAVSACTSVAKEGEWPVMDKILDLDLYTDRKIGRGTAEEYSGYAMYDRFQIADYATRYIPNRYLDPESSDPGEYATALVVVQESDDCTNDRDESATVACTSNNNIGTGFCYRGECVMDITGKPLDVNNASNESQGLTCRAYPEADSPYDLNVFNNATNRELDGFQAGFEDVNVCSGSLEDNYSCDCNYLKYKTAVGDVYISKKQDGAKKFLRYGTTDDSGDLDEDCNFVESENELCVGGRYDGYYCDSEAASVSGDILGENCDTAQELCSDNGGICSQVKGKSQMSGWKGYCIEDDVREKIDIKNNKYHCLTWWPVESTANDFWLLDEGAAYQPGDDRNRYMCLTSETAKDRGKEDFSFIRGSSSATAIGDALWMSYNNDDDIGYPKNISVSNDGNSVRINNLPVNAMLTPNMGGTDTSPTYNWGYNLSDNSYSVFNVFLAGKLNKFFDDNEGVGTEIYWDNPVNGSWNHTNAYLRNEVEEMDILIDDDSYMQNGDNGYISFINLYSDQSYHIDFADGSANPNVKVCDFSTNECCLDGIFCVKYQLDKDESTVKGVKVSQGFKKCADYNLGTTEFGYWEFSMVGNSDSADTAKIPRDSDFDYNNEEYFKALCTDEKNNGGITHYFPKTTGRGNALGTGARLMFVAGVDGAWGTADDILQGNWITFKDNNSPRMGVMNIIHQSGGSCAQYAQVSAASASTDDPLNNFSFKPVTWRMVEDKVGLQNMYKGTGAQYKQSGEYSLVTRTKDLDGRSEYGLMRSIGTLWTMNVSSVTYKDGPLINPFMPISNWGFFSSDNIARNYSEDNSINSSYYHHDAGVPLISVDNTLLVSLGWYKFLNFDFNPETKDYNSGYFNFDFMGNTSWENDATWKNTASYPSKLYPCVRESQAATDTPYCQMLKRMYTKVSGGSNRVAAYDAARPDNAANIFLNIYPPHLAADSGEDNVKFRLDSFSVNGVSRGNVVLTGSGDEASIKFYAWADPNQMPLRRIAVNANDGTQPLVSREISIGNRKPNCEGEKYCYYGSDGKSGVAHWQLGCKNDADCSYYVANSNTKVEGRCRSPQEEINPAGFGNTEDTGCTDKPLEYVITYTCTAATTETTDVQKGSASEFLSDEERKFWNISASTQVCAFTPKVQILDNWGWCSGICGTSAYTTNDPRSFTNVTNYGCFDDQGSLMDCGINNINTSASWLPFYGRVIVPQG